MKKLIVVMIMLVSVAGYSLTGFLEREWTEGMYKYCKYSNGVIITIKSFKLCPLSIKD